MKISSIISKAFFILMLASFTLTCEACRFTVREIGFSFLSPTIYSLVVIDDQVRADAPNIEQLRRDLKSTNVKLVVLNTQSDASHPFVQQAKAANLDFPCTFLLSPDERLYPLFTETSYDASKLPSYVRQHVLHSPLRSHVLRHIEKTFAYVIRIPGTNATENQEVDQVIKDDLERVNDIMELMPKSVENPPQLVDLSTTDCKEESLFLWSLGLDRLPSHPQVYILYGRGRYMGKGLTLEEIRKGNVYRYLAMVGADCECNLDREWMLGTQIPLSWSDETRQRLAKSLDFDVDNPLILAEMSRILSKEEPGGNATISYTPETIDLDEVFASENPQKGNQPAVEDETSDAVKDSLTTQVFWITLIGLLAVVLGGALYIIRKNKEG